MRRSPIVSRGGTVEPAYRIDRGRRSRRALAVCRRRSGSADVHAQRAEAAAGVAVRRRGRRRALRLHDAGGRRCCARAIPANRGMWKPPRTCSPKPATPRPTCSAARIRRCSSTRAARCRRRRPIRRSRTTARASTAGMLAHCVACGYGKRDYLAIAAIRCSRRSARAVAAFTDVPEAALRRRRSMAARRRTMRCRSRGSRSRSRASPPPTSTRRYGRAPAVVGRRDDRASGNGVGRAAAATWRLRAPGAAIG